MLSLPNLRSNWENGLVEIGVALQSGHQGSRHLGFFYLTDFSSTKGICHDSSKLSRDVSESKPSLPTQFFPVMSTSYPELHMHL